MQFPAEGVGVGKVTADDRRNEDPPVVVSSIVGNSKRIFRWEQSKGWVLT